MVIKTVTGYTEIVINKIKLPDVVIDNIKSYCSFRPDNNKLLYTAVNRWCVNKKKAKEEYGNIENWDTVEITDMSNLFRRESYFNENISEWEVKNVKNMRNMFLYARRFNRNLHKWNVSNVMDFDNIFAYSGFCKDVSKWNINKAATTRNVFLYAGVKTYAYAEVR